jgi:hypothetical protein
MINAKVEGGRHLENHFRDLCAAAAAEQPTSDVPQLGGSLVLAACVVVAKLMDALYQRLHLGCGLRL